MRNFTLMIASLATSVIVLSGCGTKGPLTLPPKPQVTQSPAIDAPTADHANTEAGQH